GAEPGRRRPPAGPPAAGGSERGIEQQRRRAGRRVEEGRREGLSPWQRLVLWLAVQLGLVDEAEDPREALDLAYARQIELQAAARARAELARLLDEARVSEAEGRLALREAEQRVVGARALEAAPMPDELIRIEEELLWGPEHTLPPGGGGQGGGDK